MSKKSRLEQAYKKKMEQEAPDLWNRIEAGLEPHQAVEPEKIIPMRRKTERASWYGLGTAAVCSILLGGAVWFSASSRQGSGAGSASMETTAVAQATEADGAWQGQADTSAETSGDQGNNQMAHATNAVWYHELEVSAVQAENPPEGSVYLPADSAYFSEGVMADTGLLCEATVEAVSYEEEADGTVRSVVYEIEIDKVLFAEDYVSEKQKIQVKSPLVNGSAQEEYVLYQLKVQGRYVLPLKYRDGAYWLVFPFAPQIEVTGQSQYIFHTGWQSLVDSRTKVVWKEAESQEDFYFDRMVLRDDDAFLPDLMMLVLH